MWSSSGTTKFIGSSLLLIIFNEFWILWPRRKLHSTTSPSLSQIHWEYREFSHCFPIICWWSQVVLEDGRLLALYLSQRFVWESKIRSEANLSRAMTWLMERKGCPSIFEACLLLLFAHYCAYNPLRPAVFFQKNSLIQCHKYLWVIYYIIYVSMKAGVIPRKGTLTRTFLDNKTLWDRKSVV